MKLIKVIFSSLVLALGLSLKAQSADGVFTKVDQNPVPLHTVQPKAPAGESGLVAISVIVDEKGNVVDASISKSTNQLLEQPALVAIKSWSFQPAKKDGKAVKVKVTVPVRFEDQA